MSEEKRSPDITFSCAKLVRRSPKELCNPYGTPSCNCTGKANSPVFLLSFGRKAQERHSQSCNCNYLQKFHVPYPTAILVECTLQIHFTFPVLLPSQYVPFLLLAKIVQRNCKECNVCAPLPFGHGELAFPVQLQEGVP